MLRNRHSTHRPWQGVLSAIACLQKLRSKPSGTRSNSGASACLRRSSCSGSAFLEFSFEIEVFLGQLVMPLSQLATLCEELLHLGENFFYMGIVMLHANRFSSEFRLLRC